MTAKEAVREMQGFKTTVDDKNGTVVVTYPQDTFSDLTDWMLAIESDRDQWRVTANAALSRLEELQRLVGRFVAAEEDAKRYHEGEMEAFKRKLVAESEIMRIIETKMKEEVLP